MSEETIHKIFEREYKWLRCKDVIEEARKEGISATTVYRILRKLVEKGVLEKDRSEWKESQYRLNFQAMPKDQMKILELKDQVLSLVNSSITVIEGAQDSVQIIKTLANWLGVLSIFNALQQIKTGKPYNQITEYYLSNIAGLQAPLRRRIVAPLFIKLEAWGKIIGLSMPTKALGEIPECKPIIESLENALIQAHPEVEQLKRLYESEGKQE